jgi:hypothetical protein
MRNLKVNAEAVRPGDEINMWTLPAGRGSLVSDVREVERPGMRYNAVQITFEDGTVLRPMPLVGSKLNVRRK